MSEDVVLIVMASAFAAVILTVLGVFIMLEKVSESVLRLYFRHKSKFLKNLNSIGDDDERLER